jgi:hypothetical protein
MNHGPVFHGSTILTPMTHPMHSLLTVEEYDNASLAQVDVFALEQSGIPCYLENETIVAMDWLMSNAVGGIRLQVAAEDFENAKSILLENREQKKARAESLKDTWAVFRCPSCKIPIAFSGISLGRVESCPLCAKYLDVPKEPEPDVTISQEEMNRAIDRAKEPAVPAMFSVALSALFLGIIISILAVGFAMIVASLIRPILEG